MSNINFKFVKTVIFITFILFSFSVQSAPNEYGISEDSKSPDLLVESMIERYIENSPALKAIYESEENSKVFVAYGISPVHVGANHAQWSQYRVNAYENAVNKALLQYIQSISISIQTKTIRSIETNLGIDPAKKLETEKGRQSGFARIISKIAAVVEGNIDSSLEGLEIDPDEFKALPEKLRIAKLRKTFFKNTVTKAFGSVIGVLPIASMEAGTKDSGYSIGAVIVRTSSTVALAKSISNPNSFFSRAKQPRKTPLKESIKKANLLESFGLRETTDDQGYPALLSFGQWASRAKPSNSPALKMGYRQVARRDAQRNADNQILTFLSGNLYFEEESSKEALFEDYEEADTDGFVSSGEMSSLTEEAFSQVKLIAKGRLKNTQTLYRWSGKHSMTGREVVGVVRLWTPAKKNRTDRKIALKNKTVIESNGNNTVDGDTVITGQSQDVF